MSAYMVSKAHIDTLIECAHVGPSDAQGWEGSPRWRRGDDWVELGTSTNPNIEDAGHDLTGLLLWSENAASIRYRYEDADEVGMIPDDLWDYGFSPSHGAAPRLTCVEALKALDCYEYQSCEHPEWDESEAKRFCDALRGQIIGVLPGYDKAAWGVD